MESSFGNLLTIIFGCGGPFTSVTTSVTDSDYCAVRIGLTVDTFGTWPTSVISKLIKINVLSRPRVDCGRGIIR
jgi:hypothetical protein